MSSLVQRKDKWQKRKKIKGLQRRCDDFFKEQGCFKTSDLLLDTTAELCEFQTKRPVYLIAVVYGTDDVHVRKAFWNQEKSRVVWLQAGGTRHVTFFSRNDTLVEGFPEHPEEIFADEGTWNRWLGYYLVPTENLRTIATLEETSVSKLIDCDGKDRAMFKHNPDPKS